MSTSQTYLEGLQAQADEQRRLGQPLQDAWVQETLAQLSPDAIQVLDALLQLQRAGLLRRVLDLRSEQIVDKVRGGV